MPFVNNDPASAYAGNYTTTQQMTAMYGIGAFADFGDLGAAARRVSAAEQKVLKLSQLRDALANKQASGQPLTRKEANVLKQATNVLPRLTAQIDKQKAQIQAVALRRSAPKTTQEQRRAAQQLKRTTAQDKRKALIEQRKAAQAAKKSGGCPPGQKPRKCQGQTICLAPGERFKCVKGQKPEKVSKAKDDATAVAMKQQGAQVQKQMQSMYCKLLAKNPKAAARIKARAAQMKPPVTLNNSGCGGILQSGTLLKGILGLFGFGQTPEEIPGGYTDFGDPYAGLTTPGEVLPGAVQSTLVPGMPGTDPSLMLTSGAAGTGVPPQLAQMMNTPPPKNCQKNPNKPVCMMYQMSQQNQVMMFSLFQMIQNMMTVLAEIVSSLQGGAVAPSAQCGAGYIMDVSGQCVPGSQDIYGPTGPYGQAPYGGPAVDPYGAVDPYAGGIPQDVLPPPSGAIPVGYPTGMPSTAVEQLPFDTGDMGIPMEVRAGEGGMMPGYMPQTATPEAIPAGFDASSPELFTQEASMIPTEMPVSQTPGMPMFAPQQTIYNVGMPSTDQYSAAELVMGGPGGDESFVPQDQGYQPPMILVQQAPPQVIYQQAPALPTPEAEMPESFVPETPYGYLEAPLPAGQVPPGTGEGIYAANLPVQDQAEIAGDVAMANEAPLDVEN